MPLQKLSDSVYAHLYPDPAFPDSNRGYIVCDDYVVVVDATYLLDNVRNDLEELKKITGRKPRYVINTHYHSDHAFGNCLFSCDIVAHTRCLELMKHETRRSLTEVFQEVKDPEDRKQLENVKYPTITFDDTYRIDSDPVIELKHLSGHTPDLSAVYIPGEKVLFASDNLFGSSNPSTPIVPEMNALSDLDQWILALEYMLTLDVNVIVPGHLGLCDKQALGKLADYLQLFVNEARELKKHGFSKAQAKHEQKLLGAPTLDQSLLGPELTRTLIEHNVEVQYDKL